MAKLSPSQLRAARGLLNWSRADLSKKSGVSEQTIHRFENATRDPEEKTKQKLIRTIEIAGVEFLADNGVRLKTESIEIFEGPERFDEFYEFIYEHLSKFGGDVSVNSADEKLYAKYRKTPELHRERMRKLVKKGKVKFRILAEESDTHLSGASYAEYRWIPKESFAPTSFYAFGDCLALISFAHEPAPYVVLHKSGPFAQAYRQSFNETWKHAKNPPESVLEKWRKYRG